MYCAIKFKLYIPKDIFKKVINRLEFKIIAQSIHNWLRVHINSSYQGYNIVICLHDSRGYKPLQTIRYLVSENQFVFQRHSQRLVKGEKTDNNNFVYN